jgi:hypothetical protein
MTTWPYDNTLIPIKTLTIYKMDSIINIKQEVLFRSPGILKEEDEEKFNNLIGKTVINLSDHPLTPDQEKILQFGLTFCPSPGRPDFSEIWTDFKEFYRRLELKKFF